MEKKKTRIMNHSLWLITNTTVYSHTINHLNEVIFQGLQWWIKGDDNIQWQEQTKSGKVNEDGWKLAMGGEKDDAKSLG